MASSLRGRREHFPVRARFSSPVLYSSLFHPPPPSGGISDDLENRATFPWQSISSETVTVARSRSRLPSLSFATLISTEAWISMNALLLFFVAASRGVAHANYNLWLTSTVPREWRAIENHRVIAEQCIIIVWGFPINTEYFLFRGISVLRFIVGIEEGESLHHAWIV